MAKTKVKEISWLPNEEEHDYPAAESFLSLIYNEDRVAQMMAGLRIAPIVRFKAKDIFIVSQLPLLG